MRLRRYTGHRAGRVKWFTDSTKSRTNPEKKKPKTGRAKRRKQYKIRILSRCSPSNEAPSPTGTHFNHYKVPKFIDHSMSSPNTLQNWQSRVSCGNANPNPHRQWSKIEKKKLQYTSGVSIVSPVRCQSHPQKTKGSTGKIIQRDRNEAAKVKLHTALYGMERE